MQRQKNITPKEEETKRWQKIPFRIVSVSSK